jgi:hypothetical protein
MKKTLTHDLLFAVTFIGLTALFSSCIKMAGHSITPTVITSTGSTGSTGTTGSTGSTGVTGTTGSTGSTGTTGSSGSIGTTGTAGTPSNNGTSPIAIGGVNTIIFQINGGTPYTWSSPSEGMIFAGQAPFGSKVISLTQINAGATNPNNQFIMIFNTVTPGVAAVTYFDLTLSGPNGFSYSDNSMEKVNIVSEVLRTSGNSTGVLTGTFDGYLTDNNSPGVSARVTGSFNISM